MKNNSFKHFGPFFKSALTKKLVLTGLLATVLSGPYVYQISSKDFNFEEFASTATESAEVIRLEAEYKVYREQALERFRAAKPENKGKDLPHSSTITDNEELKAAIKAIEDRKTSLDLKKAEAESEQRIKDEVARRQKVRDEEEAAAKKKKEDAAEAKRLDCNDKDKTAAEKRECREDAKKDEKEKKEAAALLKFDERLERGLKRCEDRPSRSDESAVVEDKELACRSKAFADALNTRDKNLSNAAVIEQFRQVIGADLFAMMFSEDERDAERASIILSNLFNGRMSGFPGIKRLIMDEVRRRAATPANKVAAEFRKAFALPAGTERTAQFTLAVAAKNELDTKLEVYSSSMLHPMQRIGDRDALAYYHSSYTKGIETLIKRLNTSVVGETQASIGGALRGGEARGGRSTTEAAVVRGADGKMTQTGGVEYSILRPGARENVTFGSQSTTRGSVQRGGDRVGTNN